MNLDIKLLIFITIVITGIFFIDNAYWGGYLGSPDHGLHNEISAPSDAMYEWNLVNKPPFKYRMLFPDIVKGSWSLLPDHLRNNNTFYVLYKSWSLLFLITSVISFYVLLRVIGFSELWTFAGCVAYMISAPVLLAYSLPVHTREDTLAYTLLCIGLVCLLKHRILAFLLIAVAGVFCRETLLLLPFILVFYYSYRTFLYRSLLALLPVATWLAIRIWLGGDDYDPWVGLKWNIANPGQVAGFAYVSFGFLWPLFLYGLFKRKALSRQSVNTSMSLFYQSGWMVLLLILTTTFVGGIYNEIRLLFLMFPWVIGISLHVLSLNQHTLRLVLKNKKYQLYAGFNILLFLLLSWISIHEFMQYFEKSIYNIRFDAWIILTLFNIFMTILFIPIFIRIFSRTAHSGDKFANQLL